MLPNGNFVVTDPFYDKDDGTTDVGRVYLHSRDGELLATLPGSTAGDRIGIHSITVLANGNYVVSSPN